MPTYSYLCQKCKNQFLIEATFSEYDKKDPKKFRCLRCGSTKIKQTFSEIYFAKSAGRRQFNCNCGGGCCGN